MENINDEKLMQLIPKSELTVFVKSLKTQMKDYLEKRGLLT